MISRVHHMIQKSFMLLSVVCYALAILTTQAGSVWRMIFCIALIITSIWHICLSKCPHCGRTGGVRSKPFSKTPVKCVHCGETVGYREDT